MFGKSRNKELESCRQSMIDMCFEMINDSFSFFKNEEIYDILDHLTDLEKTSTFEAIVDLYIFGSLTSCLYMCDHKKRIYGEQLTIFEKLNFGNAVFQLVKDSDLPISNKKIDTIKDKRAHAIYVVDQRIAQDKMLEVTNYLAIFDKDSRITLNAHRSLNFALTVLGFEEFGYGDLLNIFMPGYYSSLMLNPFLKTVKKHFGIELSILDDLKKMPLNITKISIKPSN